MLDTSLSHLAKSRHEEKRLEILRWLSYFHYSTADILCSLLGIKNKNIFSKLQKANLIKSVKTDAIYHDLWMLTRLGLEIAREFVPEAARYSLDGSRISPRLVRHNLSLQMYLIAQGEKVTKITPEKCLNFPEVNKLPDALVQVDGRRVALEIERNHKSDSRIYMALYGHALAIGKYNYYDVVTYVFPTDSLKFKYLKLFNCDEWPLYEYVEYRRRYEKRPDTWMIPPDIGQRFNFISSDML